MATVSGEFYEAFNNNGQLIKASKRFGYMPEVTLRLYDNGKLWVHLNDNSKCLTDEKNSTQANVNQYQYTTTTFPI